jgi:hypothetical protein
VIALVCLSGLLSTGCGGSGGPVPPKTYPVTGLVSYKGGPALPGGVIQFQSESGSTLTTMGDIGPDGTFELVTLFENDRLKGAVEGRYQATVLPRMTDNRPVDIFQLPRPFTVKETDNYFAIELEPRRNRPPK